MAAQRYSNKDSVQQSKITCKIMILLFSSMLMPSCLTAPVQLQQQSFSSKYLDTWWYNSCDSSSVIRHEQLKKNGDCTGKQSETLTHAVKKLVKNQVKNMNNAFKKEFKNITDIYPNKAFGRKLPIEWLPAFNISNISNIKRALPVFHLELQKYAVAFFYLQNVQISTAVNFKGKSRRLQFLKKISIGMKSLLCEIETAVNATCQPVPARIQPHIPQSMGLSTEPSLTKMYVQDWSVIEKFKIFYTRWNNYIRKALNDLRAEDWEYVVVEEEESLNDYN